MGDFMLTIPEEVIVQVQREAGQSHKSVEEVLLETVLERFTPLNGNVSDDALDAELAAYAEMHPILKLTTL